MISVPHLVDEKIWLDKPKYDAAERRYYDRLAKSSESAKVSNSSNTTDSHASAVLDKEPEVENEQEFEISPTAVCKKSDQKSSVKISPVSNTKDSDKTFMKKTEPESVSIKQDSIKPKGEENVCPRPCTELPEHVRPLISDICVLPSGISGYPLKTVIIKESQNENLQMKQELGSKPEKAKKLDLQNITSKTEINKKIESCEITCAKVRGQNKTKSADEKEMKQEIALDKGISGIDPVSEVVKLKGYYLQSKNLSYQPDSLQNKGTNVNTIPEISKISPCFEKSKSITNNLKKVPLIRSPLPDKQDSVELIVPLDSTNDPQVEDQAKKESKKKKRHKKERQRDKKGVSQNSNSWNSLAGEVAKARQHIKNSLQCIDDIAVTSNTVSVEITNRLNSLEKENYDLKNQVSELLELFKKMDLRITSLEKSSSGGSKSADNKAPAPAPAPKKDDAEDDDGVDLFGSDSEEEDAEAAKIKEQRLAEYAAKKAKKPVLIAKSNIILDVKPWDDETNMKELEAEVRKITTDGLVWGASKLVPLAYGIHKLQISCVVEDDKVSVDWLQETIQEIEDYVQSVDIAAFNKV